MPTILFSICYGLAGSVLSACDSPTSIASNCNWACTFDPVQRRCNYCNQNQGYMSYSCAYGQQNTAFSALDCASPRRSGDCELCITNSSVAVEDDACHPRLAGMPNMLLAILLFAVGGAFTLTTVISACCLACRVSSEAAKYRSSPPIAQQQQQQRFVVFTTGAGGMQQAQAAPQAA